MAGSDRRPAGAVRKLAGLGIGITILAVTIVAVFGGAGSVGGTSEAVGYPTVPPMPAPPTALPPATAVPPTPVPPTATVVPPTAVPPTATATATATATTVPPATITPTLAPTSTAVPSPTLAPAATSTITPTATITATSTSTATPRARITAVAMSIALSASTVAQGQTIAVTVHAAPGLHVAYTVAYSGPQPQTGPRGTVQASPRGLASFSFTVTPGPAKGMPFLSGSILARIADAGSGGTTSARFRVFPPLRLVTSAAVVARNGKETIVVSVQLAVRAQVLVTASISGTRSLSTGAHGTADGRHRLQLSLALGSPHAPEIAHISIVVKTKDGVSAVRNLTVRVQR